MGDEIPTPEGAGPWFQARLFLALEQAKEIYVERGNFLSDSDLVELADHWTTNDMSVFERDDDSWMTADMRDKDGLLEALYTALTPAPKPVEVYVVEDIPYGFECGNGTVGIFRSFEEAEATVLASGFDFAPSPSSTVSHYVDIKDETRRVAVYPMNVGEWYG